ncbi:hypothetical protein FB451DRAFT_1465933 [Mycena latifolia]|nr:hypothetical protein FB451DRAFT_1465933 [Mycena latifolia]
MACKRNYSMLAQLDAFLGADEVTGAMVPLWCGGEAGAPGDMIASTTNIPTLSPVFARRMEGGDVGTLVEDMVNAGEEGITNVDAMQWTKASDISTLNQSPDFKLTNTALAGSVTTALDGDFLDDSIGAQHSTKELAQHPTNESPYDRTRSEQTMGLTRGRTEHEQKDPKEGKTKEKEEKRTPCNLKRSKCARRRRDTISHHHRLSVSAHSAASLERITKVLPTS